MAKCPHCGSESKLIKVTDIYKTTNTNFECEHCQKDIFLADQDEFGETLDRIKSIFKITIISSLVLIGIKPIAVPFVLMMGAFSASKVAKVYEKSQCLVKYSYKQLIADKA
ncbi:transposase [Sediminitomix flava]|uniref:Transposase-like zinc ribbon protein n=1 Tax=Sediminitomix flava TaxID=379075 RepID=A0A315ZFC2_SEDFL|nr:transposase [Sediminitomix flava]PWJ44022.1 transposase-like zinc ribbon protein [Sediminitomix flava]